MLDNKLLATLPYPTTQFCYQMTYPVILSTSYTIDINECITTTCPANSVCMNTQGSYKCQCYFGYQMSGANFCQGQHIHCIINNFHNISYHYY